MVWGSGLTSTLGCCNKTINIYQKARAHKKKKNYMRSKFSVNILTVHKISPFSSNKIRTALKGKVHPETLKMLILKQL